MEGKTYTKGLIYSITVLLLSAGDGFFLGNHYLHRDRQSNALHMRDSSCSENYFLPGDHVKVIATDAEACLHSLTTLRVQENIKLPGRNSEWLFPSNRRSIRFFTSLSLHFAPLHILFQFIPFYLILPDLSPTKPEIMPCFIQNSKGNSTLLNLKELSPTSGRNVRLIHIAVVLSLHLMLR